MEDFDFTQPILAAVIFEDNDDETTNIKPSTEDFISIIEKAENKTLKETQKEKTKSCLLTPTSNTEEVKTYGATVKHDKNAKNGKSVPKKKRKRNLPERSLDMPSLEEENENIQKLQTDVNRKIYKKNNVDLKKQNKSKKIKRSQNASDNKDIESEKCTFSIFFNSFEKSIVSKTQTTHDEPNKNMNVSKRKLNLDVNNENNSTETKSSTETNEILNGRLTAELFDNTSNIKKANKIYSTKNKCILTKALSNTFGNEIQIQHTAEPDSEKSDLIKNYYSTSDEKKMSGEIRAKDSNCPSNKGLKVQKLSEHNLTDYNKSMLGRIEKRCAKISTQGVYWPSNANGSENLKNISSDITICDSNEPQRRDCDKIISTNLVCNNNKQQTSETLLSEKKTDNADVDKTYEINIEVKKTPTNLLHSANGDKLCHTLNNEVANYLKGLLSTVSEHMIYVMNSYQSYVRLHTNNNADQRLIENAKNNYLRTRNHFFDLSYSSVVNIILPRYNDSSFVKNFILRTTEIAQSTSNNYSKLQMESLFHDMILWVQKRQEQIQNMNINTIVNPLLAQELKKPVRTPITHHEQQFYPQSLTSYQYMIRSKQSKATLWHSGANVQESVNLGNTNVCRPPVPNVQVLQSQSKQPLPYQQHSQRFIETVPAANSCFQPSGLVEQNVLPRYLHPQNAHRSSSVNTHSRQEIDHGILHLQNMLLHHNENKEPNVQITGQRKSTAQKAKTNTKPNETPPNWQSNVLQQYSHSFQQNYQETIHNNLQFRADNQMYTDLNRSSISRDSGFTSPSNFNTNNDNLPVLEEQRPQMTITPLITHVTSLNPNASLIKDGKCTVCGKITKQKCLGCFNCYYCSHECQFLDWNLHQFVCKT